MATSETMPEPQHRLLARRGLAEVYFHAGAVQHRLLKNALYQLSLGLMVEQSSKQHQAARAQLLKLCRLLAGEAAALREDLDELDELTFVGTASEEQIQNLAMQLDDHHVRCRELAAAASAWQKDAEEQPRTRCR